MIPNNELKVRCRLLRVELAAHLMLGLIASHDQRLHGMLQQYLCKENQSHNEEETITVVDITKAMTEWHDENGKFIYLDIFRFAFMEGASFIEDSNDGFDYQWAMIQAIDKWISSQKEAAHE